MYDKHLDCGGKIPPADLSLMLGAIKTGALAEIGEAMSNSFEHVIPGENTARIKAAMRKAGAYGAVLSGSGSAVAGLFAQEAAAKRCLDALADCETLLVKPAL